MAKKFSEIRRQLSPELQARIEAETQAILEKASEKDAEASPKGDPWQIRAQRYERVLRDIAESLDRSLEGCDYDPAECAAKLFKEFVASQRVVGWCQAVVDPRYDGECGQRSAYFSIEAGESLCEGHYQALPEAVKLRYVRIPHG